MGVAVLDGGDGRLLAELNFVLLGLFLPQVGQLGILKLFMLVHPVETSMNAAKTSMATDEDCGNLMRMADKSFGTGLGKGNLLAQATLAIYDTAIPLIGDPKLDTVTGLSTIDLPTSLTATQNGLRGVSVVSGVLNQKIRKN